MIKVIGIGLDGIDGLSEKVKDIVTEASLLVGSDRHLGYFSEQYTAKRLVIKNFQETLLQIEDLLGIEKNIVIVTSGDPLFFGLGRLLLETFTSEKLEFYPHLSSVQLAFNKIKIPWQDAKIISVHGRNLDELINSLTKGDDKIAIFTDGNNNPQAIANLYLSLDLTINYDFWICENLGSDAEKIYYFSSQEANQINKNYFSNLNLVILIRDYSEAKKINLEELPILGISDQLFLSFSDRPGLMTKGEIRIMVLGELALQPNQVIWDIGAGTGSVSIEIARLSPNSKVFAIEKTAIGNNLIEKNSQRFNVSNLIPIQGKAPNILANLPNPDRIFIGGSGGNLKEILDYCQEKIKPKGIIVLALATLENLTISLEWLKTNKVQYEIKQIQISRSIPISNLTRFSPLNPVNLITYKLSDI